MNYEKNILRISFKQALIMFVMKCFLTLHFNKIWVEVLDKKAG